MSDNFVQKIWSNEVDGANGNVYLGQTGRLFFDPNYDIFKLSDGTPGGIPISGEGPQGNQGNQGAYGGPQGYQGFQGNQGYQGAFGGPQGNQGYQGFQGNQGIQGYQGHQGNQGNQSNVSGPQGNQGNQGTAELVFYDGGNASSNTSYPTFPLRLDMGSAI